MKAKPGDRLVLVGVHVDDPGRVGVILEARGAGDGPPYLVRWLDTDHVTLVFPGPQARVEPRSLDAARTRGRTSG
jgi:hypothetical protein